MSKLALQHASLAHDIAMREGMREAHGYLTAVAKELAALIKAHEAEAIELGLAEKYVDHYRENAPSKARYIELHGEAAFDEAKTISPVTKLRWHD